MAKENSLKETVVKYPYLFESRGLLVPSSNTSVTMETTNLTRKKSVSSECLSFKDKPTRKGVCVCVFSHYFVPLVVPLFRNKAILRLVVRGPY